MPHLCTGICGVLLPTLRFIDCSANICHRLQRCCSTISAASLAAAFEPEEVTATSGRPDLDELTVSAEDDRYLVVSGLVVLKSRDERQSTASTDSDLARLVAEAVDRRRNFAIISHPDAGKTTLTEKLLLYGGAIQQAGAVKARGEQRKVTSDWMELEKQRGISITSTVLQFDYDATTINLLDTPGHQDFSEDTYRTLAAADNAVMLEDAAKGLEPQTRKLFEVCRMRKIPIFTFINKMDRPGREPLTLLDEIESELGLTPWAVNWPIGSGEQFRGVIDRRSKEVVLFSRAERGKQASEQRLSVDDPALRDLVEEELLDLAIEEMELLEAAGAELDIEMVHAGELTPVFFGSAMTNFGVRPFLDAFLEMAQRRSPVPAAMVWWTRCGKGSAASCSSSRPTWTPAIATGWPSSCLQRPISRKT